MNDYDIIKNKIEDLFIELNVNYEYIEFDDDDDINYMISFNTYGKLKPINSIKSFIYLHHLDFSLNFMVFNIFTLRDTDVAIDTLDIYEVVNDINSTLFYGSFLIEENKHIFYKSSINCGENYAGLNNLILKMQFDIFISGLEKLFTAIKNKG